MTIEEEGINSIQEAVYQGYNSVLIKKRLTMLYSAIFEHASANDINVIARSISEYEKKNSISVIKNLRIYDSPTVEVILSEYSKLSFYYAQRRLNDNKICPFAARFEKVFENFISSNKDEISSKLMRLVSETMVDIIYAGGESNNMSRRMAIINGI